MDLLTDEERSRFITWLRSSAGPQAAVYRLAAFGAAAAFMAVIVAGGMEITTEGEDPFFFKERSYYEVVAQVLPVLFLTFAVERRFFQPSRTQSTGIGALLAFCFVVLTALFAELCALVVVGLDQPSDTLKALATRSSAAGITGALVLIAGQAALDSGILRVLADVIENPTDHIARERSFGIVAFLILVLPVGGAVLWVNLGSYDIRQLIFVGVVLVAISLWLRVSIDGGKAVTRLLLWGWTRFRRSTRSS